MSDSLGSTWHSSRENVTNVSSRIIYVKEVDGFASMATFYSEKKCNLSSDNLQSFESGRSPRILLPFLFIWTVTRPMRPRDFLRTADFEGPRVRLSAVVYCHSFIFAGENPGNETVGKSSAFWYLVFFCFLAQRKICDGAKRWQEHRWRRNAENNIFNRIIKHLRVISKRNCDYYLC